MSSAKRLAALELAAQREKQRRMDANEALTGRAVDLLSDETTKALLEADEAHLTDPERWARIAALADAVSDGPLPDPVASQADQWVRVTVWGGAGEDVPMAKPPSGAAAYFTAEALEWERALSEAVDPSEDFDAAARWQAAVFHFNAAMALVLEQS